MNAGSWESHHAISALMFRYAEYVDAANFGGIADLFSNGRITNSRKPSGCRRNSPRRITISVWFFKNKERN